MPRTAALKPEQVPADSKPTLDTFTNNIGFTPNMMAAFAQSPIAFNSWAALLRSLSKALDVNTRDSIGLAVSEVNGCNYCLTVHSFTAEHMAKLPADEIILARKGHASDPKRDAAVQFARKVIETRGTVSDADLKAVRDVFPKQLSVQEIAPGELTMDRLAVMETFVRVLETGSFSAAARHLNVGQSRFRSPLPILKLGSACVC